MFFLINPGYAAYNCFESDLETTSWHDGHSGVSCVVAENKSFSLSQCSRPAVLLNEWTLQTWTSS